MYLEKLEVNKIYKSYKTLCEELNEPYLHASSKDAQLKRWSRLFKFETRKNKSILILEIYSEPLPQLKRKKRIYTHKPKVVEFEAEKLKIKELQTEIENLKLEIKKLKTKIKN